MHKKTDAYYPALLKTLASLRRCANGLNKFGICVTLGYPAICVDCGNSVITRLTKFFPGTLFFLVLIRILINPRFCTLYIAAFTVHAETITFHLKP